MPATVARMDIYRTAVPMRSFEHAAAARSTAEAIVVRLTGSDGSVGWGETLPREYVTGETLESVPDDLERTILPALRDADLDDPDAWRAIPTRDAAGRCLNAAACAADVARLDRLYRIRRPPAGRISARVSGVLGSRDPARTARRLRLMRWYGLRDFKLKLGFGDDVDAENLRVVHRRLRRGIRSGGLTLRVDVNGAWDAESTPDRVAELRRWGVCAVEQPVFAPTAGLAELAARCVLPLIADESLLTRQDAEAVATARERVWWNVRLSKNGGAARAAELLELADRRGVTVSLGCMVGESGILSAAQRRVLQQAPAPRFVEGNYGRFLLSDDLTRPSPRFGWGGRLGRLRGAGLGVPVDAGRLRRLSEHVRTIH